jgi:GNAT superfamily N-acetyltransferase
VDYELSEQIPGRDALVALYASVGWTVYTADPVRLEAAVHGSLWVRTAWVEDRRLVGLARAVGDGETICYLQDVLVDPRAQRSGVGAALVRACLEDHAHVRQFVLLTDDRAEQCAFYESLGLRRIDQLDRGRLQAFARML